MRRLSLNEQLNLTGIVIALCAFTFGPWLGSRSALWIINDLRLYLSSADSAANIFRQQLIFAFLIGGLFLLFLMPLLFNRILYSSNKRWVAVQGAVSLTAVLLMSVLFIVFTARTIGNALTIAGCLLVLATAVYSFYQQSQGNYYKRNIANDMIPQLWAGLWWESQVEGLTPTIVSVYTPRFIMRESIQAVQKKLNAKDVVLPLKDGLLAMLWDSDTENAQSMTRKIQKTLGKEGHPDAWLGYATASAQAQEIQDVLQLSNTALTKARKSKKPSIFSESGHIALVKQQQAALPQPAKEPIVEDESEGAMFDFQDRLNQLYVDCLTDKRPFMMSIVSVAYFDSYQTIYQEEKATYMVYVLQKTLKDLFPQEPIVTFSTGAVMFATSMDSEQSLANRIEQAQDKMRSHGFIGEMLLPGGQIELIYTAVGRSENNESLSVLNERLLAEYSEMLQSMPG